MPNHTHPAPIPLIVVTGVHAASMAAVTVGLQWDLPRAVVVRHHVDIESVTLNRTVSDASGAIETETVNLEHLCVGCALREDILPTIARLAAAGRWESIIVHLPLAAEARHLCRIIAEDGRLRRLVQVATVVAALRGATLTADLLGGARLADIGAEAVPGDDRGVGEVLAAQVEYADSVICVDGAEDTARELLAALAQPGARVHTETFGPSAAELLTTSHDTARSEAWTATVRREPAGRGPSAATRGRRWRAAGCGSSTWSPTGRSTPSGSWSRSRRWAADGTAPAAASGCPPAPAKSAPGRAAAATSASAWWTSGATRPRSPGW